MTAWAEPEYAAVHVGTGLVSYDGSGDIRIDINNNPLTSQPGELVDLQYYSSSLARLMLSNGTLIPVEEAVYTDAPLCAHSRRFVSQELADGCHCAEPGHYTTL